VISEDDTLAGLACAPIGGNVRAEHELGLLVGRSRRGGGVRGEQSVRGRGGREEGGEEGVHVGGGWSGRVTRGTGEREAGGKRRAGLLKVNGAQVHNLYARTEACAQ
jgi:hypothetical protein